MIDIARVMEILGKAKKLAQEYYHLTGKPIGITGEVAEYEAARILGVELTPARQEGYDAIERRGNSIRCLHIKGRCLLPDCNLGQRIGSIDVTKDWDAVLLVLLEKNFNATEMHETERTAFLALFVLQVRRQEMNADNLVLASSRQSESLNGAGLKVCY